MSQIIEFADRLRTQVDIVMVIQEHVQLRKAGTNLKGLCPFHREKTPSFSVSPSRQIFHCFGCGAGGDVIKFVQQIERVDWKEALRLLAERHRIPMPEWRPGTGGTEQRDARERQLALCRIAADYFGRTLEESLRAGRGEIGAYLKQRQLDGDIVARFGLGLAPDGWSSLLDHAAKAGFDRDFCAGAGLVVHNRDAGKYYDRFRKRLIFPIWDASGRPVAFGGRIFASDAKPEDPKYINSPETALYQKSQHLYGLHIARDAMIAEGEALVMEGYLDVIRAHQHGFTNAVASCGTALTEEQARIIRKFSTRVVFAYDGDEAGQKAMMRGCEVLLAQDFAVRILSLPERDDPDSFLRDKGAEEFRLRLAQAEDFLDFFLRRAAALHDRRSTEGRVRIVEFLLPLLRRMTNLIARQDATRRVADYLSVPEFIIQREVSRTARQRPQNLQGELAAIAAPESRVESLLFKFAVESRATRHMVFDQLDFEWLESQRVRRWFERLCEMDGGEPAGWDLLLEKCEGDEDRTFLTRLAVDDEALQDDEASVSGVVQRIQLAALKRTSAEIARLVEEIERSSDGAEDCSEALKRLDQNAAPIVHLSRQVYPSGRATDGRSH